PQGILKLNGLLQFRDCYLRKGGKNLKPGKIIPIHTFYPDKYGGLFRRKIVQVSDGEVFEV
ncbi:MAG: hypothetical protein DRH33_02890, partial [Candidatus Nealsonbacteria bacterium]